MNINNSHNKFKIEMIKYKNSRNFKIKLIIKKRGSKQLKNKGNLNLV